MGPKLPSKPYALGDSRVVRPAVVQSRPLLRAAGFHKTISFLGEFQPVGSVGDHHPFLHEPPVTGIKILSHSVSHQRIYAGFGKFGDELFDQTSRKISRFTLSP